MYKGEPILYYLKDGPKRGFVWEELQIVPPGAELPLEGIRWFENKWINTPIVKEKIFTPSSELASETLRKIQVALKSRLFSKCARTVFLNQGWLEIKVKFMSCREIKVVFKIRQNCSLKVKINLDFWGKIHELPWNQGCFKNALELFFFNQGWLEIKVKFMSCLEIKVVSKMRQNCSLQVKINLDFWGKIHGLSWNQDCFQNAPELFFEG